MTTLITGAGLVGSLAAKILVDRGEKPILYDISPQRDCLEAFLDLNRIKIVRGDILDLPDLIRVVQEEKIDRIIHTAGLLTVAAKERPYSAVKVNIGGMANVLEAARLTGLKRVVFTSAGAVTAGALPNFRGKSVPEDIPIKCLSEKPPGVYAITKLAAEWLGLTYFDTYKVDFVALRFAAVFGPWPGTPGGFPPMVMKELIEKPFRQGTTVVDPSMTWSGVIEFVYAKDCANATVLASIADAAKLKQRVYNIGTGRFYTFEEVMAAVKKTIPQADIIVKEISKSGLGGYPSRSVPARDISKAEEELGFKPAYDIENAIKDYVDWLRMYYGERDVKK